ncbi:MAG TPA: ACT domain-containing protein [Clostridiaceae bacterium]|nr:ACT domain-containing protein [Clostridiaceae bacterium]
MQVKQVSVFLENKSGRLAEVTRILGSNNIDINALTIADTTEFGILRLIVDKPDNAVEVLRKNNFSVDITEVIAICVDNKPGGLSLALNHLEDNNIGIEYMYSYLGNTGDGKAIIIIRVEDTQNTVNILKNNGIEIISTDEIYNI